MLLQSKFFKIVSILTIVLSLAVFAIADTIRLKDGSVIKGKIISFDNNQFIIVIGDGARQRQMRFFADEIASIKFDSQSTPTVIKTTATKPIVTTTPPKQPSYNESTVGNTKVITVGSAPKTTNPQTPPPSTNTSNNDIPPRTTPVNTGSNSPKPIEIKAKVLADNTSNGWTNAGWVVRKGQRIRIRSNGKVSLGNGRYSGPNGISTLPDTGKLIKDKPTGGLIAVIGDDNNDFIFVGNDLEFVAQRDGALFLGVNEGNLIDNTGAFEVTIEVATTIGN